MPIRRSSAREVEALIVQLGGADDVQRDAAIARLRVIGARAIPPLVEAASAPSRRTRIGALQALETLPDRRVVAPLVRLLGHEDAATAAAAATALRPLIATTDEDRVIDALMAVATDTRREGRVRHAALRSLADLGPAMLRPLLEHIGDPEGLDPDLRRAAEAYDAASRVRARVPDDPTDARRMLAGASEASIADLFNIVWILRGREVDEPNPIRKREWMTARAVAHQRLADRGSRVALYDLRETLEGSEGPLPVEFLSAVVAIGDTDCAAALATAFAKATAAGSPKDWWTDHLASTFRAIVKRGRLTRRHAALQRVERKWPGTLDRIYER